MKSQKFFKKTTFITLVKDNSKDTLILLKYLSNLKINISHLIADGSKNNQKNLFKKFQNLKFKYYYFGEDKDYINLYLKIYKILKRVDTKYVYFLDQGDFLNFDTLKSCEKILENNKNYSCALGEVFNFKFKKNNIKIISRNIYDFKINKKKSLVSRILLNFRARSYHALHKTSLLKRSIKLINKLKINDPRTAEFIIDTNNLMNGNIYRSKKVLLLHNATNTSNKTTPLNKKHITRKIWYEQYLLNIFSLTIKKLTEINKLTINEKQINYIRNYFEKNDINFSKKFKQSLFKKVFLKFELLNIKHQSLLNFLKKINKLML